MKLLRVVLNLLILLAAPLWVLPAVFVGLLVDKNFRSDVFSGKSTLL